MDSAMDNEMDGMDGCECVFNHGLIMRRLMALLRQSQSICTDTICFDPPSTTTLNTTDNASNDFVFFSMIAGFLMLLYLIKPKFLRNSGNKNEPFNNREGPDNGSPPPAVN